MLSSGQRQTVLMARALLMRPPLLLLDEPGSHMDNRAELRLRRMLKSLPRTQTMVLVTHKSSMLEVVDRVIVMEGGRIVADGPKDKVLNALNEGRVSGRKQEAQRG
ncbi:ATP-binding cassette domain-containing protein, partial [Cobetia marina]